MNPFSLLGMVVGGVLVVLILSWLLEWAIFKRVLDEAESGITASVVVAAFLAIVLYGFGTANGHGWSPSFEAMFAYALAACIVLPLRLRSYKRRAEKPEENLGEIFE
jgi:peptidoglycan/LPS O-acetylase OafA/YrhL